MTGTVPPDDFLDANTLNEFYRSLRDLWQQDFLALLFRIAPDLASGKIPPGALPPNTMINRGTYTTVARYRPGDLVVDGGFAYVAILGSQGIVTGNEIYWQPLGGTSTDSVLIDEDGNVITDEDGEILTTG